MEYSWSRARYPLQAYLEVSPPLSPIGNMAAKGYSAPVQQKNYTNMNTYTQPPTTNIHHDDASSIVSSSAPSVGRFDIQPRSAEDDIHSSSTLHSRTQGHAVPDSEAGSTYHMRSTKDVVTNYRLPFSVAASDDAGEQSRRSSYGMPERTLRRTPRSRRIESPVQPIDEGHENARTVAWNRQVRHSRSTSSSLSSDSQGSVSREDLSESEHQLEPASHTESSAVATSPVSETVPTNIAQGPVKQDSEPTQPAQTAKAWRRGAYPLQTPASATNLRSLPTPPPSPTKETQPKIVSKPSEGPTQPKKPISAVSRQLRRHAYPLQSPASVADLHQAQLPSSKNEKSYHISSSPSDNVQDDGHVVKLKSPRRHAYPLQEPTAGSNPQHAPPRSEAGTKTSPSENRSHSNHTEKPIQTREKKALRRRAYPLQTPASTFDLNQDQEQSVADSEEHGDEDTRSVQTPQKSHQYSETSSFRRQTYPLQEPITAIKCAEKLDTSTKRTDTLKSLSPRPSNWRRQSYPLQPIEDTIDIPRTSSPEPLFEDPDVNHADPHVLLPKNIRAVTNSRSPYPKGKTIVVCLDGTGDQFDSDNSNIVHIVSALKKDDPQQVTYYQAGIGTYGANGLSSGLAAASDMAVGSGLGLHVRDGYKFLMHSYKEGDRICIFGFSRGAYTARCLAGMVHKVGLLPPRNVEQIPFAYKFYKEDTAAGWSQAQEFKKAFCIDVCVHFLGCFDSVASVGILPRTLPLSSTPTSKPRYFRHAMALDERRAKFKICRYQKWDWDYVDDTPRDENHPNLTDEEYDRLMAPEHSSESDSLEVWFAGAHADIGGGAVKNVVRHKLAQIPLRWMVRQAFECNTGIIFQTKVLAEHGLDVHTLWPKYEKLTVPSHGPPPAFRKRYEKELPPRSVRRRKLVATDRHDSGERLLQLQSRMDEDWTPEQVEDFYDSITPLNDQLIQAPTWWILEGIPVEYKVPVAPGKVEKRFGMNCGQYRAIEEEEPKMHWTVAHRMEQMGYKLGVRAATGTYWQTVV